MPVELLRFVELCSKTLQYRGWTDAKANGAVLGGERTRLLRASVTGQARIVYAIRCAGFPPDFYSTLTSVLEPFYSTL
jgi:hypothetical protein